MFKTRQIPATNCFAVSINWYLEIFPMGFAKFSQTSWSEIFWKIFFAEEVQTRRSRAIIKSNHRELRGENYAIASWTWERTKIWGIRFIYQTNAFEWSHTTTWRLATLTRVSFPIFFTKQIYFYWKLNKKKLLHVEHRKSYEHVSRKIEKTVFISTDRRWN